MDINSEVARQRAKEEAAALEARRVEAARQLAHDRRRALDGAAQVRLRPLAEMFMRWARESNIPPETLQTIWKKTLFGGRTVPVHRGWSLASRPSSIDDVDSRVRKSCTLAVLTTGEIRWVGWPGEHTIVAEEVEQLIADFIVRSKSTVPWPG